MGVLGRVVICALALLLDALPGAALAAPVNDMRTGATAIQIDGFLQGNNEDATINPSGEALTANDGRPGAFGCTSEGTAEDGGNQLTKTVWWKFVGDGQPLTVSTTLSDFDTIVAVYTEGSGGLLFQGCNDDAADDVLGSELVLDTQPGVTYFIQAGGCDQCPLNGGGVTDDAGAISILLASPPGNDQRGSARTAALGANLDDFTFGALSDAGETLSCTAGSATQTYDKTVWFRFTTTARGTATVNASGFPLVASVYRDSSRLGCGFGSGTSSTVRLTGLAPGTYFVQVGGKGTGTGAEHGQLAFRVDFAADQAPPPTDRDGDGIADAADGCPDQNASARDANRDGCLDPDPDPDRDGVPVGTDKCPTVNAAGRDTNRDGCLDKVPLKELKGTRASLRARPTSTGIVVRSLRVNAPRGAKVLVRCGKRCNFTRTAVFSEAPAATAARLLAFKRLAGRSFRAGSRIKIYVSRKNRIGKYFEYRVTKGNFRKIERCLNPGSRRTRKCP